MRRAGGTKRGEESRMGNLMIKCRDGNSPNMVGIRVAWGVEGLGGGSGQLGRRGYLLHG